MSTAYNKVNPDLIERLRKMSDYNKTALHASMGEEMRNIIEERFDNSIDSFGSKFKPLQHRYKARGTKRVFRDKNSPPLKSRTLYKSFSYNASPAFVEIGTPISYAKYHTDWRNNNGAARRYIPRREFMGLYQEKDFQRIQGTMIDFFDEYLNEQSARANRRAARKAA